LDKKITTMQEVIETAGTITSAEELLDAELRSEVKHEFQNGKLIEMSGGLIEHNLVKGEIYSMLKNFVESKDLPFMVLDSDMKTWIEAFGIWHYPDVTVLSMPPQFYVTPKGKVRRDAITNPMLLVEVLSNKTRAFDKGEKFDHYCTLPTFREYLLIEPEKVWVKSIFIEDPAAGLHRVKIETDLKASIFLPSINCELPLEDIYKVLKGLEI